MTNEWHKKVVDASREARETAAALEKLTDRTPEEEWQLNGLRGVLAKVPALIQQYEQSEAELERIEEMKRAMNNGR